jgi:hypothetical protein
MRRSAAARARPVWILFAVLVLQTAAAGQDCHVHPWCSAFPSDAYNNMHAGTWGQYFDSTVMDLERFCLCGFRMMVQDLDCSPASPCRAVLFTDTLLGSRSFEFPVLELASVTITHALTGLVDFVFEDIEVAADNSGGFIVALETQDPDWLLWQDCNAGEDCCPFAWPAWIVDGVATVNSTSGDDYHFELLVGEDLAGCVGVVKVEAGTWGAMKATYR